MRSHKSLTVPRRSHHSNIFYLMVHRATLSPSIRTWSCQMCSWGTNPTSCSWNSPCANFFKRWCVLNCSEHSGFWLPSRENVLPFFWLAVWAFGMPKELAFGVLPAWLATKLSVLPIHMAATIHFLILPLLKERTAKCILVEQIWFYQITLNLSCGQYRLLFWPQCNLQELFLEMKQTWHMFGHLTWSFG